MCRFLQGLLCIMRVYRGMNSLNTQQIILKRTHFIAVIDGVFCLDAHVMYKRETLSVVTL